MVYITTMQSPMYHQMSFEEYLLDGDAIGQLISENTTNTRTLALEKVPEKYMKKVGIQSMLIKLAQFNERTGLIRSVDRLSLYKTFYVPKNGKGMETIFKSVFDSQTRYIKCDASKVCGSIAHALTSLLSSHEAIEHQAIFEAAERKFLSILKEAGFDIEKVDFKAILKASYRQINAPEPILKEYLTELKSLLESFGLLYHTAAFAYVKGRCTISSLQRHQSNESKWYAKFDLTDFFGSTTLDYCMKMCSMVFPLSEIVKTSDGRRELQKALELGFLNGGLPQGTPLSPTLTNIIMIPVDYELSKALRNFEGQSFIYTRYADDFLVSSKYTFNFKKVEQLIIDTLAEFGAPFTLKREKTRYGSSSGSNWNLGLMLNRENKITVGYEKKRKFKAALTNYVLDRRNGTPWSKSDIQVLEGNRNYYSTVEYDSIEGIIKHINQKFGVNVRKMIRSDLSSM
jgi:RNA-directed DNA polymerase